VRNVALMTNIPGMVRPLTGHGVPCSRVLPMPSPVNRYDERYLRTKAERLGHRVIAVGLAHYPRYREQT
jgi:3,4-dihydroxy 2-butanone 4-phosphate synthase / GTP cyclohydrolase II